MCTFRRIHGKQGTSGIEKFVNSVVGLDIPGCPPVPCRAEQGDNVEREVNSCKKKRVRIGLGDGVSVEGLHQNREPRIEAKRVKIMRNFVRSCACQARQK